MRFGPMARLAGCALDLIVECIWFWPQTDQVFSFLAAAICFVLLAMQHRGTLRGIVPSRQARHGGHERVCGRYDERGHK